MGVPADRPIHLLERVKSPFPLPPLNVFCRSGYEAGVIHLAWDDPSILAGNARYHVLGVNIYRSFNSEYGPFERINDLPLTSKFYQDRTILTLVEENVSSQFLLRNVRIEPANPGIYVFRVERFPIVKPNSNGDPTNNPNDVKVWVNGAEVPAIAVDGHTGEVSIDPWLRANVLTQKLEGTFPSDPNDEVICAYRYATNKIGVQQRVFYRFSSVAVDCFGSGGLIETPLEIMSATQLQEIEKLDYIWREAIRRNRWILDQGGERVKAFIRKTAGIPCPCWPDSYHGQPINDCRICFGTGWVGGYEGPFTILMAPDDGEKRKNRTPYGATIEHNYEGWTGPSPMLSQRDFLVRQNGDRYSIGPVRMPSNRGNVLQQHFTIARLDETDIRYLVDAQKPLGPMRIATGPEPEDIAPPEITEKENIPDNREERGRTRVWENIVY